MPTGAATSSANKFDHAGPPRCTINFEQDAGGGSHHRDLGTRRSLLTRKLMPAFRVDETRRVVWEKSLSKLTQVLDTTDDLARIRPAMSNGPPISVASSTSCQPRATEDRRAPQARAAIRRLRPAQRETGPYEEARFLLERHTGRRSPRDHDGQVIAIRSNIRWCSDALEFTCWNGEIAV